MRSVRSFAVSLSLALTLAPAISASGASDSPGLEPADWAQIDALRRSIRVGGSGHVALDPWQDWRIEFDSRGFTARPQHGAWDWGLELASFGFDGSPVALATEAPAFASGARLTYAWNEILDEWFVNGSGGLEHGYTVHRRPDRARDDHGPLVVTLDVRGGLLPEVLASGRSARFVDDRGRSVLTYAGLLAFDANGTELPAWLEADGSQLRIAVDERGATYPLTIDPIAQQAYLKASNTAAFRGFGEAIAMSGDTLAIGMSGDPSGATGVNGDPFDTSVPSSGAVFVFVRDGAGVWSQEAYIKASNPGLGDNFGGAVALDGDTLVVGARQEDSLSGGVGADQTNDGGFNVGAAYVFTRTGTSWSQQAYLKAASPNSGDNFAESVGISGDAVVVGALGEGSSSTGVNGDETNNDANDSGAAYVFRRTGTTWAQEAFLKASNAEAGDVFGASVAIDGDTILVGAAQEESASTGVGGDQASNAAPESGAAYVFTRTGTTWSQQAFLKASNTGNSDFFGGEVALHGDTAIVAATWEDSNATGIDGEQTNDLASRSGSVYVFERNGGTWSQQAYLKSSNSEAFDAFGTRLALGDGVLAVSSVVPGSSLGERSNATGVNGDQSNNSLDGAGAVYVFVRSGATWVQEAYLKPPSIDALDFFGSGLAVSGRTVVVGALGEASNAVGVGGDPTDNSLTNAGAAYVFEIPEPLVAGSSALSLAAGGQLALDLDAGFARAGSIYWVFGSVTGTSPGLDLGNGVVLPLEIDAYFLLTLTKPFLGVFGDFVGLLDADGMAGASFNLPAGADPSLAGVTLHHAYVTAEVLGESDFASNPVSVTLVP